MRALPRLVHLFTVTIGRQTGGRPKRRRAGLCRLAFATPGVSESSDVDRRCCSGLNCFNCGTNGCATTLGADGAAALGWWVDIEHQHHRDYLSLFTEID